MMPETDDFGDIKESFKFVLDGDKAINEFFHKCFIVLKVTKVMVLENPQITVCSMYFNE